MERSELHDFTKSNNVLGTFGAGTVESSFWVDIDESDFGRSAKVGLPLSRGVKTVLLPEARNMPPPTRLDLTFSLACLASLNEFGLDAPFAGGPSVEVGSGLPLDGESSGRSFSVVVKETLLLLADVSVAGNFKEREDIGSKVSVLAFNDGGCTA